MYIESINESHVRKPQSQPEKYAEFKKRFPNAYSVSIATLCVTGVGENGEKEVTVFDAFIYRVPETSSRQFITLDFV